LTGDADASRGLPTLVLVALACTACAGRGPTAPDARPVALLSEQLETAHVVFHFSAGDHVEAERQEAHRDWLVPRLGADLPGKLQYFKYRDLAQMQALTGMSANGFAVPERLEVHSLFGWHAHESVHVYTAQVGRPSDFFNEGIAVALSVDPLSGRFEGSYSGEPVHAWARRNRSQLRPVEAIVTTDDFRRVDEAVGYQQAGSFVEFLLETQGFEAVRELFRRGRREDDLTAIRAGFEQSFGYTLAEAERRWLGFLGDPA